MMCWSCHALQGCVPVAPSRTSWASASSNSCCRRSTTRAAASANVSQRPVRTSTSDEMSSPTRCSSRAVPLAAVFSSSKCAASASVSGSRSANSSSTASVKSVPSSNASRALDSNSFHGASVIEAGTLLKRLEEALRDAFPRPALHRDAACGGSQLSPLVGRQRQEVVELLLELHGVALRERDELAVPPVGGLESLGDLRQPRVTRDDGRAARGGRL